MTKLKLVFAPGCFDDFEGTQEELDELIADIQSQFDNGSLLKNSSTLDEADLSDEEIARIEALMTKDTRNIQ